MFLRRNVKRIHERALETLLGRDGDLTQIFVGGTATAQRYATK